LARKRPAGAASSVEHELLDAFAEFGNNTHSQMGYAVEALLTKWNMRDFEYNLTALEGLAPAGQLVRVTGSQVSDSHWEEFYLGALSRGAPPLPRGRVQGHRQRYLQGLRQGPLPAGAYQL
jgi:hypothetical protein